MVPRSLSIGVVGVVASAAAVLLANPANANVTTVDVAAGGKPSGTSLSVRAFSTNGLSLKVVRSNFPIICGAGIVLNGSSSVASGKSPLGVASITSSSWPLGSGGCRAAGGNAAISQLGSWSVNVVDHSTPVSTGGPTANQATPVSLSNVGMRLQVGTCRFDLTGSMYGSYANTSTPTLTLQVASSSATPPRPAANLTVGNIVLTGGATACLAGLLVKGDKMLLTTDTTFNVDAVVGGTSTPAKPLWISGRP